MAAGRRQRHRRWPACCLVRDVIRPGHVIGGNGTVHLEKQDPERKFWIVDMNANANK